MANRYWVGGTATWDSTAGTKWSTTSGGAGGSAVPTSSDDVFFDASSGSGTVTRSTAADINCRNLDFTGFTGTFAGTSYTLNIYGSLVVASGMTFSTTASIDFKATSSKTITTNGKTMPNLDFDGVGGTWTLQDDLLTGASRSVVVTNGTLDLNNYDLTCGGFTSSNSNVRTILFKSGTVTIIGSFTTSFSFTDDTNLTFNAGTSSIIVNTTSSLPTFSGSGQTFYNLTIDGNGGRINGDNTFNNLTIADGQEIRFSSGSTQTVSSFSAGTSPSAGVTLRGSSATTTWYIIDTSGVNSVQGCTISYSDASGGATFNAPDNQGNIDGGGNAGWDFSSHGSVSLVGDSSLEVLSSTINLSAVVSLVGDASFSISTIVVDLIGGVSLEGTASVVINNVVVNTPILEVDKYYSYKVYDLNGDFVGQWNDVDSEFTYSQEINSAGSSVDVILTRNSDTKEPTLGDLLDNAEAIIQTQDNTPINTTEGTTNSIGPGSNVVLNYDVDVYIYYGQYGDLATEDNNNLATEDDNQIQAQQGSPDGSIIFQGYISKYISRYGGNEKTTVTLTSYGAELDNYIIESGGFTQVDWLSKDPSTILKDVIDLYQAQGGIVDYDNTTIDDTDTVVTYTFNTATTLDGIKKSLELAPSDWFWYLDMRNNLINFHNRPTTPDHTFVLGKHIKELDVEQYIDDITNVVYFSGGDTGGGNNLFLKYTDPTSETNYRRGLKLYSDNRVTLSSSADIIANSELERNSAPRYRSSVVIVDKVYDIESIQLGDLIAFRNFDNYVDDLEMQVVGIDYSPDAIRLQLDTLLPRVSKRLEDIKRNLDKQETLANPTAPS